MHVLIKDKDLTPLVSVTQTRHSHHVGNKNEKKGRNQLTNQSINQ